MGQSTESAKTYMNRIIMNFMVTEGYKDAVTSFELESGTEQICIQMMDLRLAVKESISIGSLAKTVELLNEIMGTNPRLSFHIHLQRMIERIRNGNADEALKIGEVELAPIAETDKSLLEELERTAGLLVFEDFKNCPAAVVAQLLDESWRLNVANEADAAILVRNFCGRDDPGIPGSMKNLMLLHNLGETGFSLLDVSF
ncbi:hypothetical protein ABFS82_03G010000 [Erythranthe guttata]|uniref:CTLH domain-containing protein n=1 Tax=Erythranthe guttata TaxID=4155 RepID=A0A022Q8L8_ERYGU|nr:hypothetical protein MIMGU_mgv1a014128mg [Erythranthe guttata]